MAEFPQPGETVGRYTIGERLGHGGTGAVFRAVRSMPRREVALKVVPATLAAQPGFREQFLSEADALAGLDSPHIVGIQDIGEEDGYLFIATDLVPGGDLGTRLARGPVPLKPALTLTAQVALALSAAHAAGIVHRDVKPSNVLLGERDGAPHALLCDFGIAAPAGAGGTRRSTVVGTYAYLAPEVLSGGPATPASDIYALGCLLVAAITASPPYQGTDEEVAQHHLTSEIPHWEETSPLLGQLNELVQVSMAKDPSARYASAAEFREAILQVLGEVPEVTQAPVADAVPAAGPEPITAPEPEPEPEAEPVAEPLPLAVQIPVPDPTTWAEEDAEETRTRMPAIAEPLWTPDEPSETTEPTEPLEAVGAFPPPSEPDPTPEAEAPGQEPPWEDEHPRRGGRVLISSLVALVLVGAVVAGVVLLQKKDDDKPSASPTRSAASTGPTAPTSSAPSTTPTPTPGQTKTCQEGRVVPATKPCGEPYGIPGLRYVFANITGDCKPQRLDTDKYWQLTCVVKGANPATVLYSTYKTNALALAHDDAQYTASTPQTLPSGLLQYGPEQASSGQWQVSLVYPVKHPYGVQITADSREAAQAIADGTQMLAPDDFVVE